MASKKTKVIGVRLPLNVIKEMENELCYLTIKTNTDVVVIKVESINFSLKLYKAFKSLLNKLQNELNSSYLKFPIHL